MKGPTIQERLAAAQNAATLLQLALAADADRAGLDFQEVFDALVPQADTIRSELHWLTKALGDAVLCSPAPTDDERIAGQNAEDQDHDGLAAMTAPPALTPDEIEIIRAYRSLDAESRHLLRGVMSRLVLKLAHPALDSLEARS